MQIDVTLTREDWHAYAQFVAVRMRVQRRRWWLSAIAISAVIGIVLALQSALGGWHFDGPTALIVIVLIYAAIWGAAQLQRRTGPVPEAWLGRKTYTIEADALLMQGAKSTYSFNWNAIRSVEETESYLFLMLDELSSLVIPKRELTAPNDAEALKAELQRRVASANAAGPAAAEQSAPRIAEGAMEAPAAALPPQRPRFVRNCLAGLRLLTFRKVDASQFAPSARQVLLFGLIALAIWIAFDRVVAEEGVVFTSFSLLEVAWIALIALAAFIFFTPTSYGVGTLGRSLIASASVLPVLTLLALLLDWLLQDSRLAHWVGVIVALGALVYLVRAKLRVGGEPRAFAIASSLAVVLITSWVYAETVYERPQFWYVADAGDDDEPTDWAAAEEQMYRQPELIEHAVGVLAPQDPARIDAYFLGFAGDGDQEVFAREVNFARRALEKRFALTGHEIVLANSPHPNQDTVLASAESLRRALAGLGRTMDVANDVLVLYITSHGSDDGSVAVRQQGMPFSDLYAEDLKTALDAAHIQWRVLIISACYSGTFIEPLANAQTIIFTAAREDRTSFGCSDERDLTYFGEALFQDALPASNTLLDAFARTQTIIAGREKSEGLTPSEPQLYVGSRMRSKLKVLDFKPAVAGSTL